MKDYKDYRMMNLRMIGCAGSFLGLYLTGCTSIPERLFPVKHDKAFAECMAKYAPSDALKRKFEDFISHPQPGSSTLSGLAAAVPVIEDLNSPLSRFKELLESKIASKGAVSRVLPISGCFFEL
jgi:hypothetical protein